MVRRHLQPGWGIEALICHRQLTNLGTLPLDRIHSNLSRFLPDYAGKPVTDLAAFLAAMAVEGQVEALPNNQWRLTGAGKGS
jgi:hypothetical protein